jgi:hypothetical protein
MAEQAGTHPAGTGARHFLEGDDLEEQIGLNAAIGFGITEPEDADLGGLAIEVAIEHAGPLPGVDMRLDLGRDPAAHAVSKRFVLSRVVKARRTRAEGVR